jgi:hypothetical protein
MLLLLTWHCLRGAPQGVLHAHVYRSEALARWLSRGGGGGATHPATRARVALDRDVFWLR